MVNGDSPTFVTRSVKVNGFTIQVRSRGNVERKTVLLIHGLASSEKYFRRLAYMMTEKYCVVSINLPGYGDTKKPSRALNLDELTDVTAQFIRQEKIRKPIIIGHSMGSQIVARLCSVTNLPIDRIVLLSPTVNLKERTAPQQLLRLLQDIFREPLDVNLLQLFDYIKFGPIRYLRTQRFLMKDRIEESLVKTSQPVIILCGARDKIVPLDWVLFLSSIPANGSFVDIKGGAHNIHYTHPKDVFAICSHFIEQ